MSIKCHVEIITRYNNQQHQQQQMAANGYYNCNLVSSGSPGILVIHISNGNYSRILIANPHLGKFQNLLLKTDCVRKREFHSAPPPPSCDYLAESVGFRFLRGKIFLGRGVNIF